MGNIAAHENDGRRLKRVGRTVNWVQTPETTGGKYSSVCHVVYEPGQKMWPAHSHDKGEETIYVKEGRGKVRVGEETYELRPGSVVLFPQGVPHIIWNNGETPLCLVCFYAPGPEAVESTEHRDFDFE